MANLQDVIERMKAEGDLTRNSGTNSIKQTNRILGEMNMNLDISPDNTFIVYPKYRYG